MELNFVQSSEVFGKNTLAWETEFEATGDFNLHVERNKGGDILVYQRTAGSGYAIVEEFRGMDNKPAIDLDFTSVVYPKFVKIVSESQPTYATVTTDGEITEIKSQSKEIEVTSNGTINVTPDAGFSYLNSVKVKTNVAQSGEGGGGAGDSNYIYFNFPELSLNIKYVWEFSQLVKIEYNGMSFIVTPLEVKRLLDELPDVYEYTVIKALCIDLNLRIITPEFNGTFAESIGSIYVEDILSNSITEEEFYTL